MYIQWIFYKYKTFIMSMKLSNHDIWFFIKKKAGYKNRPYNLIKKINNNFRISYCVLQQQVYLLVYPCKHLGLLKSVCFLLELLQCLN